TVLAISLASSGRAQERKAAESCCAAGNQAAKKIEQATRKHSPAKHSSIEQGPTNPAPTGQLATKQSPTGQAPKLSAAELFSARAQLILGSGQPAKGEWGILIADAATGQVLFEQNADRYFVPASNMKLFTTALALAKLGTEYRFRTTLEALVNPDSQGKIAGPLFLVGRGDPN